MIQLLLLFLVFDFLWFYFNVDFKIRPLWAAYLSVLPMILNLKGTSMRQRYIQSLVIRRFMVHILGPKVLYVIIGPHL